MKSTRNNKRSIVLKWDRIYKIKFCIIFLMCLFFTVRPYIIVPFIALGIVFFDASKIRIKRINNDRRYMMLVVFWLYCGVVSLVYEIWNQSISLTMFYRMIWTVILIHLIMSGRDYISLIQVYKKILFVCACFGIVEYVTKVSIWNLFGLNVTGNLQYGAHRISVIFYNPLIYASFLLIAFWIEWCYPCKNRFMHYLMAGLFVVNIVFTEARSAWVTLACGVIISMFTKIKKLHLTSRKLLYGIFVVPLLCCMFYLFRKQLLGLLELIVFRLSSTSVKEGSYIQRVGVIKEAFEFFVDNPAYFLIGGGYGYSGIFIREHPVVAGFYAIDNQYIYYLLNYGIIGIALFLKATFWRLGHILRRLENVNCKFAMLCNLTLAASYFFFDAMSWSSFLVCYALTWGAIDYVLVKEKNTDLGV